jgi:hypothetical protein
MGAIFKRIEEKVDKMFDDMSGRVIFAPSKHQDINT